MLLCQMVPLDRPHSSLTKTRLNMAGKGKLGSTGASLFLG